MKTRNKLSLALLIILLSISSVYPTSPSEDKKDEPTKEKNSFWENHQLNWKNINQFNSNSFWNHAESFFFNDRTITISNKKIATSKDDSYEDNKGNNDPTDIEGGNIRWKGYRFQNLNIPANAIITNVELIIYGYKHGNTTVSVKAENLKSPTSYTDDDDYLSSRSTTSKSINWSIPKLYNGLELKSPNLKDVVQEVVNNKGGITHLSLIIQSSKKWECWNFDDRSSSYYPKINISYTVATPDVSNDQYTMDENTVATINIFNNDENIPSNGKLTISTAPKNGTVVITDPKTPPNNTNDDVITYTPNTNFDGTDAFKYKVCDSSNNCDTATVSLTINSVIDPCNAALSGNLDTDKDGIADVCDLDDDNDGILDEDECPAVDPFTFKLNINNKKFTNSGRNGDVGDVMLYRRVGTHNGTNIDLKLTVTANSDPENMTIDISGFKFDDDIYPVLLDGNNTKEIPYATVKFEFLKSNTNELVNVAPSFMFKDIDFLNDGTGESVEINKNLISSYSLSKNPATDLYIVDNVAKNYQGTNGNFLRINSKKEGNGLTNENLWINLQLTEVNSFNINFLKRTGNTGYVLESDNFSKSANTVQLDADCSLDSDADGIPDYLDTDSDNDGCPDATEAEKNMETTATLAGGSNGGSSQNLGIKSNKNGIPIPFGTTNGSETKGQNNTDASKTAEKITVNTTTFSITQNKHQTANLTINASALKTNTFAEGVPNYNTPNGTDTSNSLTYQWYKKSDLNKRLSTNKTLPIYNVTSDKTGEYIVIITGINSSCSEEATFTLLINDTPTAQNDFFKADEDSQNHPLKILDNDDFGDDDGNGTVTLASETSEKGATITLSDNGTPNNQEDDFVLYTPIANFNGSDSFNYTITDASGDTSTTRVGLYINAVNDLPTASNDTETIDEDSEEITINVTNNDDFGGDGSGNGRIIITNTFSEKKGKISVDTNGTSNDPTDDKINYTPLAGFNGTDTFTYKIQDANGDSSTATVTITVNAVNDLPIATADAITVKEDSNSNYIDVLDNDNFGGDGVSSSAISVVNTTSTQGGTVIVNNNNTPNNPEDDSILYTPLANFNGQDTFEYVISDVDGDTSTATVIVTVTAVNDIPNAKNDSFTVEEDSANNSFNVLQNDSFGGDGSNSGKITLSKTTSREGGSISIDDNGTPTDPTDDKITYTPLVNANGNDYFEYSITDANGDKDTSKVNITINSVNDLPTAGNDTTSVEEDSENNQINVLNNDSFGGDGYTPSSKIIIDDTNTFGTAITNDSDTSLDPTDDYIVYTPAENFNGTDTISYTIIDANGDEVSATVTITVNAVNDLPTALNDTIAVEEDSTNNIINVTENDDFGGDGANSATISLPSLTSTKNGTISIDDNGTATDPTDDKISYSPFANYQGQDSFTYTITDANGDESTATVTINVSDVNDIPVATNDNVVVNEDTANNVLEVLTNDNFGGDGANSGTISLPSLTSTENGTISIDDNGTATDPTDDKIIYTPLANFNGSDKFSYSILDANGDKATATVSITVNAVNDLPTATNDSFTLDEDASQTILKIFNNDSYGGDGKPSTNYFTYTNPNQGGKILVRPARENSIGGGVQYDIIYYTPAPNYNGTETFTYTITDTNGDKATATATINVNSVNDLPNVTNDAFTVAEDSENNSFVVVSNDDFGGDGANSGTISIASTTTSENGTIAIDDNETPTDSTDDKINYTPFANFNGTDSFEYTITDANGDEATASVIVTVNAVNDVPVAENDVVIVSEDSSENSLNVLTNDSFGGDGSNTGKITITSEVSSENGLLSIDDNDTPNNPTDDTINYTPVENFNGTDTFSYSIIDANGDVSTAEVTITVTSINDTPTATNDAITVDEDSNTNSILVTTNDNFGGDGANSETITVASTTTSENGTVAIDDNGTPTDPTDDKINYTPFANFNGTDAFEYTITDADGDTSKATVTVTVTPVNDIPTANEDSITVDEDSSDNSINVTNNDNFGGDGANAEAIMLVAETSEKGGAISVDDNGTATNPSDDKITYTPALNYNGTDYFEYTITDSNGDTSTTKVSIIVNAVNDLPTATNDTFTVDEDSSNNSIAIFTNDNYGGDGKPAENYLEIGDLDNGGRVSITPNTGAESDIIFYTPAEDFYGVETFSYSIIDANGDKATAKVSITVNNVNDNPITINDNISVDENSTNTTINVLENDTFGGDGANSEAITIANTTSENGGTVSVNNNGTEKDPTDDTIIYTPLANFTGTDAFEYTITDADGETSSSTVTITVNPSGTKYNPLASADCFNIFVKNNLTLNNGSTSGSIAVGGDLTFSKDYAIASEDCGCFAINDIKIGVLVGGKVNYPEVGVLSLASENQYAKIGEDNNYVWYQNPDNSASPIRITPQATYNAVSRIQLSGTSESFNVSNSVNPVIQKNIIDFESVFQQLQSNSLSMSKELNSVAVLDTNNQEIANTNLPSEIVINLESSVSYLNITGEDLNKVTTLNFFNTPNANNILIINVNASDSFDWNVWEQKEITQTDGSYIIYNFYNTKNLTINGTNEITGSVLAPFANITKTTNTANISGQVIGQSLAIENGNINCSIFESDIYSPEDAKVNPTADFTSNNANQCFVDNSFEFTNTSNTGANIQPTAPINYAWDFGDGTSSNLMNPSKTYAEAGTYSVKLTATNTYGATEKTVQVIVESIIDADVVESNSIKNDETGTVTKEFTLNNDTDFSNFTWSLDGFDTSSFDNQKIISLEFTEEGEYTLIINTKNNNCTNTVEIPITITSDQVSTGNDGGLESESLGDAISIRYFQRKRKSVPTIFKKTREIIYNKRKMVKSLAKKSNELTMLEMFPERLVDGDLAHVTSPTDILDFTVADEVLSVDFSVDDKTIGVVLGVKTLNQIYNHTKATCDRLRGAEILNVKTIEIGGYNFLQQAIQQRNGIIEHAISFAVSKNKTEEFYRLQTNWYVFDYVAANDVYNFQVWASEPANTTKMVTEILANLNNFKTVEQVEKQKIPRTYVTKVARRSDKLNLELKSFEVAEDLEISIAEKLNETTSNLNLRYTPLTSQKQQTLQLDINDGYEYDGDIVFDGEVQDAFYHADGNWGLDYDRRYTTVNEYEVTNNFDREYKDDELPINRNVSIKAYSEYDYLAVYKSLLPGTLAADYTAYNYLAFKAKGNGPTQLVLVKAGIENWSQQFRATVNLTEEEKTYYIPFESLTSTATTNKIVADDLTTVSFTYIAEDAGTNNLDMKISDVKFTKTNTALSVGEFIAPKKNEFFAYPNPTKGDVNCTIFSETSTKAKATLVDITGKTIYKDFINLSAGKNELKFNFKAKTGVLFLKINSNEVNYGTSKIIFR